MKYLFSFFLLCSLSLLGLAEGSSKGGDDFRKTAKEYQQLAGHYGTKGHSELAALYTRMSEIKIDAAVKADAGQWDDIDWSEYFAIEDKVAGLKVHQ